MRATTTLEKVINTVHEQSATNYDEMVSVQDMRFSSLEQMDIAGQSFGVLPSAQKLLANRLRVPFSYLSRCPREIAGRKSQLLDQAGTEPLRGFLYPHL